MLLALAVTGCGGQPAADPEAARGWERIDLRKSPPAVEPSGAEVRVRALLLGDGLMRPDRRGQRRSRRLTGEVLGIEAPAGSELLWRGLEIGQEPYLSYIPLTRQRGGCRPSYRVRARGERGWQELHRHPAMAYRRFAPATEEVSLAGFAGRTIDLGLSLELAGRCARPPGQWGAPAVYSRRQVAPEPVRAERSTGRPNVILIGLDTVRADALGVYGRRPSLTPALDRLAAASDVWLEAFSTFNVTNPSFASILTGLYGTSHGVYDLETPLGEEHDTLAEIFRRAGWRTGAVVAARHLAPRRSGLGQGFEDVEVPRSQLAAVTAVDEAIDWLSRRRAEPFFFWLHLFDPHTPHTAPLPFSMGFVPEQVGLGPPRSWRPTRPPEIVEYSRRFLGAHQALYDAEVAYTDHHLGRLLDFLDSRGLLSTTIVALVADHGENRGEHGLEFRHSGLWDATTHVPLLIRWPGASRSGRRITGLVQTIDLFPTLLRAAGLEVPAQEGRDLLRGKGRRAVFAEAYDERGMMVRTAEHLYFEATKDEGPVARGVYLFDLEADPAQTTNLAGRGLAAEAALREALARWRADRPRGVAPRKLRLSEDEREDLRSLGYLGGS